MQFFVDFSIPFDAVSHSIPIDELSSCGMSEFTLFLVKNWMKGRAERIVVNGMTIWLGTGHQQCSSGISSWARFVQCVCQKSGCRS